jgi:hypothetical protein
MDEPEDSAECAEPDQIEVAELAGILDGRKPAAPRAELADAISRLEKASAAVVAERGSRVQGVPSFSSVDELTAAADAMLRYALGEQALEVAPQTHRCNICGGLVDLTNAKPPTVSFGKGAKGEPAAHRTEDYARFMAEHAAEAYRSDDAG